MVEDFSGEVFATDEVFDLVKDGEPFRKAYRKVKEGLSDSSGEKASEDRARQYLETRNKKNLEQAKNKWSEREAVFVDCLRKLKSPKNSDKNSGEDSDE